MAGDGQLAHQMIVGDRLLILACSATKRSRPGWIPAVDRYDGPLWQTLRAIGPDRQDTKVDRKSTRLNSSHYSASRMPSSARTTQQHTASTQHPKITTTH